jgi:hypothetical protein
VHGGGGDEEFGFGLRDCIRDIRRHAKPLATLKLGKTTITSMTPLFLTRSYSPPVALSGGLWSSSLTELPSFQGMWRETYIGHK